MAQHALGNVSPPTTTTALRATNNGVTLGLMTAISGNYPCQALQFQALSTNTGSVYIVDRETPDLSLHVLYEIPAPNSSPSTRPAWSIGDPTKPAAFNASTFWIVPAIAGNGVRVTVIRG